MPGEPLSCVWQAVASLDVNRRYTSAARKEVVQEVTSMFRNLQTIKYAENRFDQTFTGPCIKFKDYKTYVYNSLQEIEVSRRVLCDSIEDACWDIAKHTYTISIPLDDLQKLWKITNRLIEEDTYPPMVRKEEACWLTEKIFGNLGMVLKSTDGMFKSDSLSFIEIVEILEDRVFKEARKDKVKSCIDDLYLWLVVEMMKKEKVYIRCKKQSNWTMWAKRCCILTPRSVCIYTGNPDKVDVSSSTKKIELVITKTTTVKSLPMYSGIIHHFNRRFSVANQPHMDLEIAVDNDYEKSTWLSSLEEIMSRHKENTTPVQKLLHDRYTLRVKETASSKTTSKSNTLESLGCALDESHKRASRAILNKPEVWHVPLMQVQEEEESQESSDIVTTVDMSAKISPKSPVVTPATAKAKIDAAQMKEKRETNDVVALNKEKLKAVFMKIDENGNGLLDKSEFSKFIEGNGLKMTEKELNLVFKTIDTSNKGQITFEQFDAYFTEHVLDETSTHDCVQALRRAFMDADRDGSGTLNFREFTEYVWEKKRSVRMSQILKSFSNATKDEITFTDFQQMVQCGSSDALTTIIENEIDKVSLDDSNFGRFEGQLKQVYSDADSEELGKYIRNRWNKFATFRRKGNTGSVVMKGGHGMVADFVPGEYSLIDLTCFSDLPPLIPKHTVITGVTWESSTIPGKSGKIIFPSDFDGEIVKDLATTELVRYYNCSFADANQEKISLLCRHGIQDFTYENGYLEQYVATMNGGSGIEMHEFSHLDCPLSSDSGTFVLAKFTDEGEFHITGFNIPVRHTLYIPGGVIHSNDYLKGTWRTMLSDETDIDHVHLTKRDEINDNETKIMLTFV